MQDIIDSTAEDGHTTLTPVSYDYRISNLCNFKCRMCGEQLSSSWETEKIIHDRVNYDDAKWMVPDTRKKISKFQKDVLEVELQEAVDNGTIEEIYWVGGEPLMYDIHWRIMQQLVDSGKSKDVVIRYNTNLSRVIYKNYSLYDLLPHFKKVNVCASIDGVGTVGEYIRTGLKWNQWIDNFKQGHFLIDQYGDDALVFDVTLTTPGLFDLKNMFDCVSELGVKSYFKITFAFDPSVVMSPLCLPKDILEETVNELLEYMEPRVTPKTQVYIDTLKNLLTRPTFYESYPDAEQGIKQGKRNIEFLESIRDCDVTFRSVLNDRAKEWWDKI
jgi:sulfatase maturation enzyme AslB (radical SAM superfamily)